jgi:hypothetical protein
VTGFSKDPWHRSWDGWRLPLVSKSGMAVELYRSSVETEAAGRRGAGIVHDILSAGWLAAGCLMLDNLPISMGSSLPFHFRPL